MNDISDTMLLRDYARQNSEAAFAELVRRHLNLVYSAALRHVGIAAQAEEIAQAVFIILAHKAGRLREGLVVEAWLFETTRLTALSFLRAERRRRFREQEACYMQSTLQESTSGPVCQQLSPLLDEAMMRLRGNEREALVLRFFKDRSLAEVAAALNIKEPAAQMRVTRGLEKLRNFFAKRGVHSTTAIIAGALSSNSLQVAPPTLAQSAIAAAMAKGAAASTSTATLVKGALKIMAWSKAKTVIVIGLGVLFVAGTASVVVVQKESLVGGKTETEWIASIVYRGDDQQVRLWHSLGEKGIQMLLRAMKPSPAALTYERALDRHETVDDYAVLTNGVAAIGAQMRAGFLLGQLADKYDVKSAIPKVIQLLKTEADEDVRAMDLSFFETPIRTMSANEKAALLPELVRSLNGIGSPGVPKPYDEYANSISDVRNNALGLLPGYPDQKESLVPLVIDAMKDPNPLVRMRAVDTLNKLDPQNAASAEFVPVLVGCLASPMDKDFTAVNESALRLGEFHRDPAVAVPALIQAVQTTNGYALANIVRANAAWALGKFGGQSRAAIPALQQALADSDQSVREQVAAALKQIESKPEGPAEH